MAQKKQQSRAEKAASAVKSQKKKSSGEKKSTAQNKVEGKELNIPIRFYSASIFLGLFFLLLIFFFTSGGAISGFIRSLIHGLIGVAGFIVAIPVMLYLFFIHAFSGKRPVMMRTICLLTFVFLCGCLFHLISDPAISTGAAMFIDLYDKGSYSSGGIICGGFVVLLNYLFDPWFSGFLLVIATVITLLAGMQITIPSIIRAIQNRPRPDWEEEEEEAAPQPDPATIVVNHIANKHIEHVEKKRTKARLEAEEASAAVNENKVADMLRQIDDVVAPVSISGTSVSSADLLPQKEIIAEPEEQIVEETAIQEPETPAPMQESIDIVVDDVVVTKVEPEDESLIPGAMPELKLDAKPASRVVKPRKVTPKDAEESATEVAEEIEKAQTEAPAQYCYPPIDLLKKPEGGYLDGTAEMRVNSSRLREALASFKIDAHIVNVTRGPSITRYEVELEKGVRLSKLTSSAEDLALSLGATGVRIAAIPDKISVVGIEVPNKAVNTVTLREVIDSAEFTKAKSKSSFAVGKDIGGSCIVGNIAKLPHMLIAGTTGSGKSVCMNSIIISILYKASPEDVKLIMVDPKMVELGIYNGIPHLLIPVVTDPKKAAGSLQWAVTEMMRRYKAMSDAGVRDLESYNSIMEMEEGQKLPQVVVIIDELADLMLVAAKEVEESICRIAQMGRAAGIHLIIATQRPSADVITGLMKANIPSRIAFSVASAMESRIILDTQGAEKLVGKGDMLYAPIGSGKPKRVQGCFVSDSEVEAVASYVKSNFASTYDKDVMEQIEQAAKKDIKTTAADPEPNDDELAGDEMLPAAVDVILETGQASVSMLQRRLKLGYARAARIVDEMEELGIVGPFQGSKPRAILVTKEQWQQMRGSNSAQLEIEDPDTIQEEIPF